MNKVLSHDDVVALLRDGMTLGIGGWGSRRKPMSLVRAICRSDLKDLTVVSYGGPDVGLLVAAGKVAKVVFGFVTLDTIPLEPHFRRARQEGVIEAVELDEGMLAAGLEAEAKRLPFLPVRAGIGSDILRVNPWLKVVTSPYDDETPVVAVPPIRLDAAICHVNRASAEGTGQILGPDPYFDDLYLGAAQRRFISCESIGLEDSCLHSLAINRFLVDGVVEAPGGARFTSCEPDYPRDEQAQRAYVDGDWKDFV